MTHVLLAASDLGLRPGPSYAPGGIQSVSRMLARILCETPSVTRVSIWSLRDEDATVQSVLPHLLRDTGRAARDWNARGFGGCRTRMAWALWRTGRRVDHVMFTHIGVGVLAAWLPASRSSIWLHGIEAWERLDAWRRKACRKASALLSVSAHTARRLAEFNPDLPVPRVVHLGLEPEHAWKQDATRASQASPVQDEPCALVVGRLSHADRYKGYELVLRAWPRVIAKVAGARLQVVGDGDDRPRLEQLGRALPPDAAASVLFSGALPHHALRQAYREATVFVLPSTKEGFGLVHLEAMQAGVPSIACRDGAAEVVEDGVTGLVVEPTEEGVAEALVRLLGNRPLAQRMGEAGRTRLDRMFTYAAFRARVAEALRGMGVAAH